MIQFLGEKSLANKIKKLKKGDCPYTLFLGAGASKSSGIPLAKDLIFEWQEMLFEDLKDGNKELAEIELDDWRAVRRDDDRKKREFRNYDDWKEENNPNGDSDYSLLFSTLYQRSKERQLFIEQVIDEKKPTFGYLFLSGLIEQQKFNRILTTNFDDLISDSLFTHYDIKPITCAFDSMVSGIRIDSQRPKIIKLHGDFLFDNLRNIRAELKSLDANIEEKMLEMCKDRGLMVVGYAGDDMSVMDPIKEMLRKKGYLDLGLHWCFLESEVSSIPQPILELKKQYSDKIFFYRIKNFDSLMETMFTECQCKLPDKLEKPGQVNPIMEFHTTVTKGKRSVDLTKYQARCLNIFLEANIKKRSGDEHLEIIAENYFAMGKTFRDDGDKKKKRNPKEARVDFLAAIDKYNECDDLLDSFFDRHQEFPSDKNLIGPYIYALKRKSGVLIAKAKVNYLLDSKKPEFLTTLDQSLAFVDTGIKIQSENLTKQEIKQYTEHLRSFYLNGCCANSLKAECNNKITDQIKDAFLNFLEGDIALIPDKSHFYSIIGDPDIAFLRKKVEKEIGEKFKIEDL